MKIKTIRWKLDFAEKFDEELNEALAEGYQLIRRDIVPGFRLDGGGYLHNMLYAELILPDPAPKPETEPIDPIKALHRVKEFCRNTPAHRCVNECPLYDWCHRYAGETDPGEWELEGDFK